MSWELWQHCRGEGHDIQNYGGQGKLSRDTSATLLDQPILLLGQLNNYLKFQRRLNTASALYDDKSKEAP